MSRRRPEHDPVRDVVRSLLECVIEEWNYVILIVYASNKNWSTTQIETKKYTILAEYPQPFNKTTLKL